MKFHLKTRDLMKDIEAREIYLEGGFLVVDATERIYAFGEWDYCYCVSTGACDIRVSHRLGSFCFGCDDFELREGCVLVKANGRTAGIIKGVKEIHFNERNNGSGIDCVVDTSVKQYTS